MFEKKVVSSFMAVNSKKPLIKDFYILTHKKHRREIFFEKGCSKSLRFMEQKFNSFYKKIIFFLIRINILPIFLKKIKLDSNVGQLIFVAGQIKGFNLTEKTVLSFPLNKNGKKLFIKSKEYQKKMANKGFAPKILKINKQIPFSVEELLSASEKNNFKIFKKLFEYYEKVQIKKESSKKFVSVLTKKIKNEKIKNLLQKISIKNTGLLITQIHGDFAQEQVLKKNGEIVFTDWDSHPGLIIEDIVNFFCGEEDLLKNKEFQKCLKLYPNEVQEKISDYLILNEIIRISKNKANLPLAKIRIKKLLSKKINS